MKLKSLDGKSGIPIEARAPLMFSALSLAIVILYWPATSQLFDKWQSDDNYAHGWLVFTVALFIALRRLKSAPIESSSPDSKIYAAIIGCSVIWLLAFLIDVTILQQMLLPVLLLATAYAVGGKTFYRRLSAPVGLLYFAIPFWDVLNPLLQAGTVVVVGTTLDLLGIPSLIEENTITIAAGSFEIAAGCSGLRFFVISLTLGAIYSYSIFASPTKTLKLIVIAGLLSIVGNWARVFAIIMAGQYSGMGHVLVRHHGDFGWFVFIVTMVVFFVVARTFDVSRDSRAESKPGSISSGSWSPGMATLSLTLLCLASGPLVVFLMSPGARSSDEIAFAELVAPGARQPWSGPGSRCAEWQPYFSGSSHELSTSYGHDTRSLCLYVSYYSAQSQDGELINDNNRIADPLVWRIIPANDSVSADAAEFGAIYSCIIDRYGSKFATAHLYVVGGIQTTSRIKAQLLRFTQYFSGRHDAMLISVATACRSDCAQSFEQLAQFLEVMSPELMTLTPIVPNSL